MPALLIATAFFIVFLWGVLAGIILARLYPPPAFLYFEKDEEDEKSTAKILPFRRR